MLTFNVALDQRQVEALMRRFAPAELKRRQRAAMTESVQLGVRRVVSRTPKRTGGLAASIGGTVESESRGVIQTGISYGPFVEGDTRPHIITPKSAKALFWPGAAHPVKQVQHPGTKGRHMFEETAEEMGQLMAAIFERHMVEP